MIVDESGDPVDNDAVIGLDALNDVSLDPMSQASRMVGSIDEMARELDPLGAMARYDKVPLASSAAELASLAASGVLGDAFGSLTFAPEMTRSFSDLPAGLMADVVDDDTWSSVSGAAAASVGRFFDDLPPDLTSGLSAIGAECAKAVGATISGELLDSVGGFATDAIRPALSTLDFPGMSGIDPKSLGFASMASSIADVAGAGSLSERFSELASSRSEIEEMFESPALQPYRHSVEALDAALGLATAAPAVPGPVPVAPARVDEPFETSWNRIEGALVQLVQIGERQATHLDRIVEQAEDGARTGKREFRLGFAVGVMTLAVTCAGTWFGWQAWVAAL
jgi:hypothetical protein